MEITQFSIILNSFRHGSGYIPKNEEIPLKATAQATF